MTGAPLERRRKPMRKAFREQAEAFLEATKDYYEPATIVRIRRNLRTIEQDLQSVNEPVRQPDGSLLMPGPGLATAPKRITPEHIGALLRLWDQRRVKGKSKVGLDLATRTKYIRDLRAFLGWCGNPVFEQMRYVRLPKPTHKGRRPRTLTDDQLDRLRAAAEGMEGWRGVVARLLVDLLPNTGLRPKEIR